MTERNWLVETSRVDETVTRSLQAAESRLEALGTAVAEAQAVEAIYRSWQEQLAACLKRVQQLQNLAAQAEQHSAAIDQTLADGEQTLQRWLEAARVAREELAQRLGRAVG